MSSPFDRVPLTPATHFRVNCLAAAFHVLTHLRRLTAAAPAGFQELLDRHPVLRPYLDAATPHLPAELAWDEASRWWQRSIGAWEVRSTLHLPLLALGLSFPERMAVLTAGLVEDEARLGPVLAEVQHPLDVRRPTVETLALVVKAPDPWLLRDALVSRGLVEARDAGGPRSEDVAVVPLDLWRVLRGGGTGASLEWGHVVPCSDLEPLDALLVPDDLKERLRRLSEPQGRESARVVMARGPTASGRRRLLGAVAAARGSGALFVDADELDGGRWRRLEALGAALGAMPVVSIPLSPGQTVRLPGPAAPAHPLGVVVGLEGGLDGPAAELAVRVDVPATSPDERRRLWRASLPSLPDAELDVVVDRLHLPRGHIRRVAGRVRDAARLADRDRVMATDVVEAGRNLSRERLDTLAQRLDAPPADTPLIVDDTVREHLLALRLRCCHRERIAAAVGPAFGGASGRGVRVLLTGPSGTGKTLACRLLAASLQTHLYRVDLSAVVDKYVGETEKNLHRVLSAAEELDVVLLLDEGDSLLGARTEVRTANDRYANLQTNFLLQRLETYQGIVLVTTNAPDSVDAAFARRMDAVLHLTPPGPAERRELWEQHLSREHRVGAAHLDDLAVRAELTGGQIRNACLLAALLALDDRLPVGDRHVDRALAVEYGKAGAVSPFQPPRPGTHRRRRCEAFLEALP